MQRRNWYGSTEIYAIAPMDYLRVWTIDGASEAKGWIVNDRFHFELVFPTVRA